MKTEFQTLCEAVRLLCRAAPGDESNRAILNCILDSGWTPQEFNEACAADTRRLQEDTARLAQETAVIEQETARVRAEIKKVEANTARIKEEILQLTAESLLREAKFYGTS